MPNPLSQVTYNQEAGYLPINLVAGDAINKLHRVLTMDSRPSAISRLRMRLTVDSDFVESKHPRDADGKFGTAHSLTQPPKGGILIFMIRLKDSYWQPIHREIQNFLWLQFFDPIFTILAIKKPFHNARSSNLQAAIAEGRVFYDNGVFTGQFDIRTSKELSEFATFNPRSHSWVGLPPPEIIATASRVKFEAKEINEKIARLLPKFEANYLEAVKNLSFPIMHVIDSLNGDVQDSLQSLAILPELTDEAKANLAEFYNDAQRFNIVNWGPDQIERIRQVIEQNVMAGYNREELERLISEEWEVSANKARFLARQETSLFVSRFRDERYQSAGVEYYTWMSSNDARCREANKHGGPAHGPGGPLHGHVFRFDDPPVSGTRGEKENPGIPFGCRCIARPMLNYQP